jgi:glycosyltransferase involved in cell wall biosynthesis
MRRFTILLAAYDRLELLKSSVESGLAQNWGDFEVLAIDDGSGRETADWLDEQAAIHDRLRVVHQPNSGVAAARANGVQAANFDHVVILDSDDRLEPNALQRYDQAFTERPETDLFYGNIRHVFPDGKSKVREYRQFASNRKMIWGTFLYPRVPFKHSGTCFKRTVALELGNYDASMKIKIDVDIFLKFMHKNRSLRHLGGDPLVSFHVHDNMMSLDRSKGISAWFELIDRYGSRFPLARTFAKTMRGGSEIMKAVYEKLRF